MSLQSSPLRHRSCLSVLRLAVLGGTIAVDTVLAVKRWMRILAARACGPP